ncbi:MAG: type 4a pilus biogenesis protein PilO [Patescibacteria group bacterium]
MRMGRREWTIVAVVGVLAVLTAGYFGYQWYDRTYKALLAEKAAVTSELARVEQKVRDLAKVEQRLAEARRLQADYERLVPKTQELPQLLRDTYTLLSGAGAVLASFAPSQQGTPVPTAPELNQLTVSVSARGTYPEILAMFGALRSWRRLLGVNSFSISRGSETEDNQPVLSCQFTMVVFYSGK